MIEVDRGVGDHCKQWSLFLLFELEYNYKVLFIGGVAPLVVALSLMLKGIGFDHG